MPLALTNPSSRSFLQSFPSRCRALSSSTLDFFSLSTLLWLRDWQALECLHQRILSPPRWNISTCRLSQEGGTTCRAWEPVRWGHSSSLWHHSICKQPAGPLCGQLGVSSFMWLHSVGSGGNLDCLCCGESSSTLSVLNPNSEAPYLESTMLSGISPRKTNIV